MLFYHQDHHLLLKPLEQNDSCFSTVEHSKNLVMILNLLQLAMKSLIVDSMKQEISRLLSYVWIYLIQSYLIFLLYYIIFY